MKLVTFLVLWCALSTAWACDLCGVYRAVDAGGESRAGLVFSVAEQFIPYDTTQFDGEEVHPANPDYINSSITHFIVGYNFSSRFGISLSVPLTSLQFKRTDLKYSLTAPPVIETEKGRETGLGDISLIGRVAVIQETGMDYGFVVNLLAGVKFPTGDDERLDKEIDQTKIYDSFLPPGTPHDPLGHSISSVHQHNLTLGSGSYDGVFGATVNAGWKRWFVNAQFQYYLRTEGDSGFTFGDELIVSGGPGGFLVLNNTCTLSLQALVVYDTMGKDELLGRTSDLTGMTAWYLGPVVSFTWGDHFSANVGVDFPLHIDNNGYQVVPDYRLHGGVSWRF